MNRFDWFFRQKVTEAELDGAFDAVENALFNLMLDCGYVGITTGAVVTENAGTPNLTVDVSGPASIYDQLGQRISWGAAQDVDCSVDENSITTAVATPGNEKYLSVFAEFTRTLSDPRLDGDGATVQFSRAESFQINVAQGAEAVIPTATPPALRGDQILLADIRLINGQTQILNADIDTSRRQWMVATTGISPSDIGVGTVEEAVQELATRIETTDTFTNSGNWHDGTGIAATTIEAAVNEVKNDLATDTGNGGDDRIGAGAKTVGVMSLAAGSINDQLVGILNEIQQIKRERAYMQVTSCILRKDIFDPGGYIYGISFGNNANEILSTNTPVNIIVGMNTGSTAGKVYSFSDFETTTDQTSNLINAPDKLYDAVYIPSSNRHIIVGRIDASSGADIETCDDELGVSWTSRTPTGMTAAGDVAWCVVKDEDSGDVIVGGANGKIIRSTDDGASWAAATTIPGGLTSHVWKHIGQNGLGDILITGNAGADSRILHSNDGGDTWTDVTPGGFSTAFVRQPIWDPTAQRWFVNEQAHTYRSTNSAGTAWAAGTDINASPYSWVTDGDSGVIFGLWPSGATRLYATEDLGVNMLVDAHFENNPDGATHTTAGWEYPMPQITPNEVDRGYFAQGRFWFPDGASALWVSPTRRFTRLDGI